MSWTSPTTRATGDLITASIWNADLVNNLLFLYGQRTKKTTTTTLQADATETDMLNGEFTVAAGALGTDRKIRLWATGDVLNNTGAATAPPRWRVKLGGTTILDSLVSTPQLSASATRGAWVMHVEIQNAGATNAQKASVVYFIVDGSANNMSTGQGFYGLPASGCKVVWWAYAASTVDTTAACALTLTAKNDTNAANLATVLYQAEMIIE